MNGLYMTLLMFDLSIIGEGLLINDYFTNLFNDFIREKYQEHKELFSIIFNIEELEKYINEGNTKIVSRKNIKELTSKYNSVDKYLKLLDEVGLEVDSKLNEIAILFFQYYQEHLDSLIYIETPYIRVLQ